VGQLTLQLLRFKSSAAQPGAPIVYLAGGPGDSGINELQQAPLSWLDSLRTLGDVIALDQRGTGASEPRNAQCDGGPTLPLDRPANRELYAQAVRERVRRCAALTRDRGVALDALTTAENADDLETLRRALGVEQLRLFGGSYGSHLGLAAVRRHPRLAQRIVLASIEGPDYTLKLPSQIDAGLHTLSKMVLADTFYARRLPDLPGTVRKLLDRLEHQPVRVTIDGQTVVVGAWDLRKFVADAMGRGPAMRRLPATLLAMAGQDFTSLGHVGARLPPRDRSFDDGCHNGLRVVCLARSAGAHQTREHVYSAWRCHRLPLPRYLYRRDSASPARLIPRAIPLRRSCAVYCREFGCAHSGSERA
jgi:pimeloyl-ACP methyl ester carboxylesterase